MFSAFQTFGRLGAGARAVAAAWSPSALWPTGTEPGMWISPSTLPASFNDYLGTTPVATPGTVADTSNPVGLALDIRAGAPTTLGPELMVNGDFSAGATGWTLETGWSVSGGQASITNASNIYAIYQAGLTPGKTYFISFTITSISAGAFTPYCGNNLRDTNFNTVGTHTAIFVCGANGYLGVRASALGTTGSITNISFKEIPGHHMLQATSAARPLMSARKNTLTYTEAFGNEIWVTDLTGDATLTKTFSQTDPLGNATAVRLLAAMTSGVASFRYASGLATEQVIRSAYIKSNTGVGYSMYLGDTVITLDADTEWHRYDVSESGFTWGFRVQFTSAADITLAFPQRELGTTATPYQSVPGDGSTYSATGITPFQLYDGVDDSMATASFAAGTLSNNMDCLIAVRRDSEANCVAGLYNGIADATKFFGMAESGSGSRCVGSGAGTPTVWVDNIQLTGGTAVTRGTLHTALTAGNVHILEFQDLDLSAWTATGFGLYTSYVFPGARGDIMLFPSTAITEDKDAARQYLADKYGVKLA